MYIFIFRKEKKALEEEMNRRSVRDMEARQQCFKGECEIRQLKKEMRRDKLQLKELEQQISALKSKSNLFILSNIKCINYIVIDFLIILINNTISILLVLLSKENMKDDKPLMARGVRFHENCKIEDGGNSLIKPVKKIPQQAVLNTIVCPKLEDL